MIYNELGNLENEVATGLGEDISMRVTELFTALFKDGMTVVEARALTHYLVGQVDVSAIFSIIKHQYPQ